MSQNICDALGETAGTVAPVPFLIAWASPSLQTDRRKAFRKESWQAAQADKNVNLPVFPHQCMITGNYVLGTTILNSGMMEVQRDFLTTPELKKAAEAIAKAWALFVAKSQRESSRQLTSRLYEELNNR